MQDTKVVLEKELASLISQLEELQNKKEDLEERNSYLYEGLVESNEKINESKMKIAVQEAELQFAEVLVGLLSAVLMSGWVLIMALLLLFWLCRPKESAIAREVLRLVSSELRRDSQQTVQGAGNPAVAAEEEEEETDDNQEEGEEETDESNVATATLIRQRRRRESAEIIDVAPVLLELSSWLTKMENCQ